MDQFDEKILHALSRDGRMTHTTLGKHVGLSPSAVLRRVQDLEKRGIITGYRAIIDPAKIGNTFIALIGVGLNDHTKASQEAFERSITAAKEVRECHNVTGTIEYMLRVEVEDLAAFKKFHTDILGALPQVNAITTFAVMSSPKDERG